MAAARQAITSYVPTSPPSRTEIALGTEVSMVCIQAGLSAIQMLHRNLQSTSRIFSTNAVFVTLSAATILVAASLVPELNVNLDDDDSPYGDAVEKAFQVLDKHMWQVEGARGARDQLKQFLNMADQARRKRSGLNGELFSIHRSISILLP
jgi:hypothetical protein